MKEITIIVHVLPFTFILAENSSKSYSIGYGGGPTLFNFSQKKETRGFINKDDNIHKSESVVQTNSNTCRLSELNNQNINV